MKVGTLPWLLQHEWRLWSRHPQGLQLLMGQLKTICGFFLLIGGVMVAVGLFQDDVGAPFRYLFRNSPQTPDAELCLAIQAYFMMFFYTWIESKSLLYSAFVRSVDLQVLTASPINPQRLFLLQLGKIALTALFQLFSLFCIAPIFWPSLRFCVGIALANLLITVQCTCLLMWMVLGVTRWWGIKRASQVSSLATLIYIAAIGGYFSVLPESDGKVQPFFQLWQQHRGESLWWGPESWLWLPARTILLDPVALLVTFLLTGMLVWISFRLLPLIFVDVIQQPPTLRRRWVSSGLEGFASGVVRSIIRRERRTLLRTQRFWFRAILLIIAVVGGMLFLPFLPTVSLTPHLPAIAALYALWVGTRLVGQFTRSSLIQPQDLNWLDSVPATSLKLQLSKALAVLQIVWLVFVPMVSAIAYAHGPAGLMTLILLPMTISQAFISMWHVGFLKLTSQNSAAIDDATKDDALMYLGVVNVLSWFAIATLLYFQYWLYGCAAIGLSLGIMALAYWRSHQLGDSLISY